MIHNIEIQDGIIYRDGTAYVNINSRDSLIVKAINSSGYTPISAELLFRNSNVDYRDFKGMYFVKVPLLSKSKELIKNNVAVASL